MIKYIHRFLPFPINIDEIRFVQLEKTQNPFQTLVYESSPHTCISKTHTLSLSLSLFTYLVSSLSTPYPFLFIYNIQFIFNHNYIYCFLQLDRVFYIKTKFTSISRQIQTPFSTLQKVELFCFSLSTCQSHTHNRFFGLFF